MAVLSPAPGPSAPERPAPGWELVLRRNSIERLKRDRPPLEVRSELAGLIARGYEEIAEEEVVRLYWWGLAHDKPKVGTFMVRVKVPGGRVTPTQLRALGQIAGQYGQDQAELTTRQGIQLHWVKMAALPEVLDAIDNAGLTTAGAEGDTVRNVTSCPVAGLDPGELFDVSGVVREVSAFFSGNPEYSNLPRKHKYTISACPAQCNAPEIHDVALVGVLRDGEPGFAVRVGGGMSNTPRISRDLGVFVPLPQTLPVLRAITDAWQHDLRYRMSRAKARIKFMVDDYGPDGIRRLVEERLGAPLPDGAAPAPVGEADHMGVCPQRQQGRVYVGVPVPSGRVTGSLLRRLADLSGEVGADVRFTHQQNLILGNVPASQLLRVRRVLQGIGLPAERSRAFARSVACTSHQFCNYSVAETKGKLDEILGRLVSRFGAEAVGDLTIHMDGCPHACAQHWIGEIGLQGTTAPTGGGERVEAYDLTIGGGLGRRTAIGRRL
ncbi:MAG TPA: nitrite/sulfite reductase, partial [Streptosporangiaceae bacterium]